MEARSLTPVEARVVLTLEAERREDLSVQTIQDAAGISRGHARKIAASLQRKGWIQAVGRGRYLLNSAERGPDALPDTDPLRVGSRITRPYYFAYGTAANLRGLTTQTPRVYLLASPTRRQTKLARPVRFHVVPLAPHKFFGFEETDRRGTRIRISDLEKTVLDCLDRPDLCGGLPGIVHVLTAARPHLSMGRLVEYLGRFKNHSLAQRLGYLLEHARLVKPASPYARRLHALIGKSFVPLDPRRPRTPALSYDHRWRIIQNVSDERLFGEVRIG